jgi:F0F1-type ATP synthase assembly protein I
LPGFTDSRKGFSLTAMVWFVGLQAAIGFVLALVVLGFWGLDAAGSVLLGSAVVWGPNLVFALRLSASREQAAAVWLVGQLAKLGLAVMFLLFVAKFWPAVSWPGLLVGLAGAGLSVFVGPWFTNRAERRAHSRRIDALLRQSEQRDSKV